MCGHVCSWTWGLLFWIVRVYQSTCIRQGPEGLPPKPGSGFLFCPLRLGTAIRRNKIIYLGTGRGSPDIQKELGASLVAQWLRVCLPVQGTQVQALVREDPTCCRATKPVRHNYRACEPQLLSPHATTTEARAPRARALQQEKPLQWEARAGSVVVAHGLSCSTACEIFSDQGSNPCPLHWQVDS